MKMSQTEGVLRRAQTGSELSLRSYPSSAEITARFGNEDESVYFDNSDGTV